ncbi:MAG: hypothetical protein LH660_09645, partial [Phormidesmis sp. CAN_BIN36]|nr:hypothetical protein [Phormidesmis sp. CAN_BIN36]
DFVGTSQGCLHIKNGKLLRIHHGAFLNSANRCGAKAALVRVQKSDYSQTSIDSAIAFRHHPVQVWVSTGANALNV